MSTNSNPEDLYDFWNYIIGVNCIPFNSKNKVTYENWSTWQDQSIPVEVFENWKENGLFDKGIAVIAGKIWRGKYKGKYLACVDIDNKKGKEEFLSYFGQYDTLEKLAQKTIVEQHRDNLNKVHIYFVVEKPLTKKSGLGAAATKNQTIDLSDECQVPAIEVKSEGKHGVMIVSPSIHKNGFPYEILGIKEPTILNKEQSEKLENMFSQIYDKYDSGKKIESNNIPISKLFEDRFVVYEGNNRHVNVLRLCESLYIQSNRLLTFEELLARAMEWNERHCRSPLEIDEIKKLVRQGMIWIDKESIKSNKSRRNPREDENDESNTSIENLLTSIKQRCNQIFFDQFHELYVSINIRSHHEVIPIASKKFESVILSEYYENNKLLLSKDKLSNVLGLVRAREELNSQIVVKDLNLRIAKVPSQNRNDKEDRDYYYDLINSNWQIVKITTEGWEIISGNEEPIFKRYRNNLPQVIPNRNYPKDIMDSFLTLFNIPDKKNNLLLLVYLICLFIPDIAKPILILRGSKGSAKTTAFELIKNVVDPSDMDTLFFPKELNDLIQIMNHNYVLYFDNISYISSGMSDLLCRTVTGTGFSKRKLYSDDEDVTYKFKRSIGINGINLASVKPDFLDRSLIIELERITKDKRRKDEDIKTKFRVLLPDILGWIFDILVKVLKYKKEHAEEIKLKDLPRMAEFAEYGEVISRCIGYDEYEFIDAYFENIDIQNEEVIESSIIARVIIEFMENRQVWKGTSSELYSVLMTIVEDKTEGVYVRNRDWPKAANSLSRKINEIESTLKEKGIEISHSYDNKRKSRIIILTNIEKISSLSSYRSNDTNPEEHYQNDVIQDLLSPSEDNKKSEDKLAEDNELRLVNEDITTSLKQPNIHEIARKLYPGSDIWICNNCTFKGDKFDLLSHPPHCKNNRSDIV